jgi:predicted outer membrane protein
MSVFTKVCAGLLMSALSLSAHAAQPETEGQSPVQEPGDVTVEVSNATEVIQVLHVGVQSEIRIIDLIRERNPDADLQQFIDQLSQDVSVMDQRLEELAASKSVGLAPEQLTENAKMIETQMAQEVDALGQKADAEFRAAAIEALINKYQKGLELYTQVEQSSTDMELKSAVAEIRPVTQKHLDDVKQLQSGATQPSEPMQPSQPQPVE